MHASDERKHAPKAPPPRNQPAADNEPSSRAPVHSALRRPLNRPTLTIVKTLRRHIAVWLLLLILPLQAVAAYAPVMPCGEHGSAMQSAHETQMDHQSMATADEGQSPCTEHQSQGGSAGNDFDGHSCCHQVFTAAASVSLPFAPEAPRVITQRVPLLNTLFIPELPQRPPRA